MKTSLKITALLGALIVSATSAFGVSINGSIAFDGSLVVDQPIENSPSEFLEFTTIKVSTGTQSGDYFGTAGSIVSMNVFSFSPFNGPISELWSFSHNGLDYSFDLNSVASITVSPLAGGLYTLSVAGSGVAHITGFDSTPGVFSITTTGGRNATNLGFGAFSFAAAADQVPDSSSTAILLGGALLGFVTISRKLKRNR